MSLFSKLFGKSGKGARAAEPEAYNGFLIFPEPIDEGGSFRIGARIEKEIGDEVKVHKMVRADTYAGRETAEEASLFKAKQFIDQQGDRIFG